MQPQKNDNFLSLPFETYFETHQSETSWATFIVLIQNGQCMLKVYYVDIAVTFSNLLHQSL